MSMNIGSQTSRSSSWTLFLELVCAHPYSSLSLKIGCNSRRTPCPSWRFTILLYSGLRMGPGGCPIPCYGCAVPSVQCCSSSWHWAVGEKWGSVILSQWLIYNEHQRLINIIVAWFQWPGWTMIQSTTSQICCSYWFKMIHKGTRLHISSVWTLLLSPSNWEHMWELLSVKNFVKVSQCIICSGGNKGSDLGVSRCWDTLAASTPGWLSRVVWLLMQFFVKLPLQQRFQAV